MLAAPAAGWTVWLAKRTVVGDASVSDNRSCDFALRPISSGHRTPVSAADKPFTSVFVAAHAAYLVHDDRWQWDEQMFRLHGFEPGQIVPTTGVLLAHTHPEDRSCCAALLEAAVADGESFVCQHRVIDALNHEHIVVALGQPERDENASVRAVQVILADVTDAVRQQAREAAASAVRGATATRAVIDEAKGALMAEYGLTGDQAFEVLRTLSNNFNVKVVVLAEAILELFAANVTPWTTTSVQMNLARLLFRRHQKQHSTDRAVKR